MFGLFNGENSWFPTFEDKTRRVAERFFSNSMHFNQNWLVLLNYHKLTLNKSKLDQISS